MTAFSLHCRLVLIFSQRRGRHQLLFAVFEHLHKLCSFPWVPPLRHWLRELLAHGSLNEGIAGVFIRKHSAVSYYSSLVFVDYVGISCDLVPGDGLDLGGIVLALVSIHKLIFLFACSCWRCEDIAPEGLGHTPLKPLREIVVLPHEFLCHFEAMGKHVPCKINASYFSLTDPQIKVCN